MNALAGETSPYLLQHKDNPVDWHVWNSATLEKAAQLDKPILLSVGYSACHWCHVMAAESFENADIAALMNELFIPVKVDREERPDIDAVYQNALALMSQHGGWPLTMFLTPTGQPYWGGTYYPPTERYGRAAFPDVLTRAAAVYRDQKGIVEKNTTALTRGLVRNFSSSGKGTLSEDALNEASRKILSYTDSVEGGLGQAPKFPQSPVYGLLWRTYKRRGDFQAREAVLLTLTRMTQGGIYDHLGGGFSRYSTDAMWLVPHFEKMLYDNAQLIELLCWAYQETQKPLFAERVCETIGWLQREMAVEGGGFAAALDADSEHEEGAYYVWTAAEVDRLLGDNSALFKAHYDVHRIGNWEGKSILNRSADVEPTDPETERQLASARTILLAEREKRVHPGRDHKVLADWNGLAVSALTLASGVFQKPQWLETARVAYDFILREMTRGDRLFHSWCGGRTQAGLLDDYAAMSRSALSLYQTSGDLAYLEQAQRWAEIVETHFPDNEHGGYFSTSDEVTDLYIRPRSASDHATPSGNAMMLEVLATLYYLTGENSYYDRAEKLARAFMEEAVINPIGMAGLLSATDFLLHAVQIVLVPGEGLDDLEQAIAGTSIPHRVLTLGTSHLPRHHPAAAKTSVGGKATAYICRGQSCSLPVTTARELLTLLQSPGDTA